MRVFTVVAGGCLVSRCPAFPSVRRWTPPPMPPAGGALLRLSRPQRQFNHSEFPILAGQTWRYIYLQLRDFKEGRRNDPLMSPMAADLSRDDMIALGNFFAAQKPLPDRVQGRRRQVEAGGKIADAVLCPMCHLGGFVGQNEIPRVAGQHSNTSGSSSRTSRPGAAPTTPAT